MFKQKKKAVVLLSGGIDSTTCMAVAASETDEIYALSFDYGQKHSAELEFARFNAENFGATVHRILKLDNIFFQNSALTNKDIAVPKYSPYSAGIPATYVPARNTVFLSYALSWAETVRAEAIYIGVNSIDYSGYPDCRPEFISAFEKMANLAVKEAVEGRISIKIKTPLISMTKAEIIRKGKELGIDYSKTISCYNPSEGRACGCCDSCIIRKKGFEKSGFADETIYV